MEHEFGNCVTPIPPLWWSCETNFKIEIWLGFCIRPWALSENVLHSNKGSRSFSHSGICNGLPMLMLNCITCICIVWHKTFYCFEYLHIDVRLFGNGCCLVWCTLTRYARLFCSIMQVNQYKDYFSQTIFLKCSFVLSPLIIYII